MATRTRIVFDPTNTARMTHVLWRREYRKTTEMYQRLAILMFILGLALGVIVTVFTYNTFA